MKTVHPHLLPLRARAIVMAPLLMSLELTGCNDWRPRAPAEADCAVEWGAGGVNVWTDMHIACRCLCLLRGGKTEQSREGRGSYTSVQAGGQAAFRCRPEPVHLL